MFGLLAIVAASVVAFAFSGNGKITDEYLHYVIAGTPVVGLIVAATMVVMKRVSIVAGFCFSVAASAVGFLHYLFWATAAGGV